MTDDQQPTEDDQKNAAAQIRRLIKTVERELGTTAVEDDS